MSEAITVGTVTAQPGVVEEKVVDLIRAIASKLKSTATRNNKQKSNHRGHTENTEEKPFIERYRPIYYSKMRSSEGLKTNFLTFEDVESRFKLKLCVLCVSVVKII